jgi:hypothetical protein
LVWDDNLYIKQGLLFTEKHSLLDSFKYGYFREQMGMKGAEFLLPPPADRVLHDRKQYVGPEDLHSAPDESLDLYLLSLLYLPVPKASIRQELFSGDRDVSF